MVSTNESGYESSCSTSGGESRAARRALARRRVRARSLPNLSGGGSGSGSVSPKSSWPWASRSGGGAGGSGYHGPKHASWLKFEITVLPAEEDKESLDLVNSLNSANVEESLIERSEMMDPLSPIRTFGPQGPVRSSLVNGANEIQKLSKKNQLQSKALSLGRRSVSLNNFCNPRNLGSSCGGSGGAESQVSVTRVLKGPGLGVKNFKTKHLLSLKMSQAASSRKGKKGAAVKRIRSRHWESDEDFCYHMR